MADTLGCRHFAHISLQLTQWELARDGHATVVLTVWHKDVNRTESLLYLHHGFASHIGLWVHILHDALRLPHVVHDLFFLMLRVRVSSQHTLDPTHKALVIHLSHTGFEFSANSLDLRVREHDGRVHPLLGWATARFLQTRRDVAKPQLHFHIRAKALFINERSHVQQKLSDCRVRCR